MNLKLIIMPYLQCPLYFFSNRLNKSKNKKQRKTLKTIIKTFKLKK